jgi:hypothetical protein
VKTGDRFPRISSANVSFLEMSRRQFTTLSGRSTPSGGAAYVCEMWPWKKKPEPPLRDQLIAARADLRRQIEILQVGPSSIGKGGEFIDNTAMLAELRSELSRIEDALGLKRTEIGPWYRRPSVGGKGPADS